MSILDTSSQNTFLAETMTNTKAAADLVTGPLNPSSYIDPVLSNISLDQLPNLDPAQALDNLVGDDMPPLPPIPILNSDVSEFISGLSEGLLDKIGSVYEIIDVSDELSQIMEIVNGLATVVSYVENGIQILTDGNIPEEIKTKIVGLVSQSLMENGGTAALGLYSEVSGLMLPFVSGHTESALSTALKASRIFGMAGGIADSLSGDVSAEGSIESIRAEYDGKLSELTTEFDALTTGDGLLTMTSLPAGTGGGGGGGGGGGTPGKVYRDAFFWRNGIAVAFPETFPPNQIPPEDREAFYAANLTDDQKFYDTPSSGGGGAGAAGGTPSVTAEGIVITAANPPNLNIPVPPPDKQFKGVDGNWEFESGDTNQFMTAGGRFVSSVEELECEMSAITRPISEVIVHWSETYTNANLTGLELQQLTGAGSNAYHYIIKRDGSMERGVPLDGTGSASPGHNTYSIQICLVGGVNVASGDDAINGNIGASSITRTQFNTLHQLFRVFFVQFPGGQALGHGEFDLTQLDPGFEVRDYVYNAFNKRSLYIDPMSEPEKSPEEIISSIDDPELLITEKDTQVAGLENF